MQLWVGESRERGAVLVQGNQLVAGVVCDVDPAAIRTDCTTGDSVLPSLITVQLPALAARHVVLVKGSIGCDVQVATVVSQPSTWMLTLDGLHKFYLSRLNTYQKDFMSVFPIVHCHSCFTLPSAAYIPWTVWNIAG